MARILVLRAGVAQPHDSLNRCVHQ
jgi:hypothetical protein